MFFSEEYNKEHFLRSSIFHFPESENLPLIVPLGFLNIHAHVSSIAAIIRLTLVFPPKPRNFSLGVNKQLFVSLWV